MLNVLSLFNGSLTTVPCFGRKTDFSTRRGPLSRLPLSNPALHCLNDLRLLFTWVFPSTVCLFVCSRVIFFVLSRHPVVIRGRARYLN